MRKAIAVAVVISVVALLSIGTADATCGMTGPNGRIVQIVKWSGDITFYRILVSQGTSATGFTYWTAYVKTTDPLYLAAVTALASGVSVRIYGDLVATSCPTTGGNIGNLVVLDVIK